MSIEQENRDFVGRQLTLLEQLTEDFEGGLLSLHDFCNSVSGLASLLEEYDEDLAKNLGYAYCDFEVVNAVFRDEEMGKGKVFDEKDASIIEEGLRVLKNAVADYKLRYPAESEEAF